MTPEELEAKVTELKARVEAFDNFREEANEKINALKDVLQDVRAKYESLSTLLNTVKDEVRTIGGNNLPKNKPPTNDPPQVRTALTILDMED